MLTPNRRELERLAARLDVAAEAADVAAQVARKLGNVVVVAKGQRDVITDGTDVLVCDEPGAPKRCGGLGDVLCGALAPLAAQAARADAADAAFVGRRPLLWACYGRVRRGRARGGRGLRAQEARDDGARRARGNCGACEPSRRLLLLSRPNRKALSTFVPFAARRERAAAEDEEVEGARADRPVVEDVVERAAVRELPAPEHEALLVRLWDTLRRVLNHLLYVANGVVWLDLERDGLAIPARDLDGDLDLHALYSIRALHRSRRGRCVLGFGGAKRLQ